MPQLNPHNCLTALSPPGAPDRQWRCFYCDEVGTYEALQERACSYVYPPCDSCGQTPLCARDCGASNPRNEEKRMTSIDILIKSKLLCAHCKRPERGPTVASGSRLYCSLNCLHTAEAHRLAAEVLYVVESNRGGSPIGLAQVRALLESLEHLEPVHQERSTCPECWAMGTVPEHRAQGNPTKEALCPWGHTWTPAP